MTSLWLFESDRLRFRHTHDELYPPTRVEHPFYLLTREDAAR